MPQFKPFPDFSPSASTFDASKSDASIPCRITTNADRDELTEMLLWMIMGDSDDGEYQLSTSTGLVDLLESFPHYRIGYLFDNYQKIRFETPDDDPQRDELFYVAMEIDEAITGLLREQRIEFCLNVNGTPCIRIVNWVAETKRHKGLRAQSGWDDSRAKIQQLRALPYNDYLQSEHWYYRRLTHLAFAEHRCQVCNSEGQLHVHHRSYERRGYERASDLIVLCAVCHKLFHDNGRLAR